MILIIISLFWFLLCSISGIVEAHYYHVNKNVTNHKNIRGFYYLEKLIIMLTISGAAYLDSGVTESVILFISMLFTFPFFHHGFYYLTGHKLNNDIYPKGFWDSSELSPGFAEIGSGFRTALAAIGTLFIIALIAT